MDRKQFPDAAVAWAKARWGRPAAGRRRGVTLLLCLMVLCVTSVLLLGILDTVTVEFSAIRNTADYERALYLAGAGVHHALAEIEADGSWTGDIPSTEFPAGSGNTYQASAVSAGDGTVVVTGTGTSGAVTRSLQVTIEPGG